MNLVLIMTRGISLKIWDESGSFDREIAYYKKLIKSGHQVTIVSYGNKADLLYQGRLGGIKVVCNRWGLSRKKYENWLPILFGWVFLRSDVIKSNQIDGSDLGLKIAKLWNKPFIARAGFLYSLNIIREYGEGSAPAVRAKRIESMVFPAATRIFITTQDMKSYILNNYNVNPDKIDIIPNYVDTEIFKPSHKKSEDHCKIKCLFIGRLEKEKNLFTLLKSIKGLPIELTIIGNGSLKKELETLVIDNHLPVTFLGNIPNHDLPIYLNESDCFILPSLYEGHPKTLLEAMACGVPVIGANSPGIRDIIQHRVNGYLCGTTENEIRSAIIEVSLDKELRQRMGLAGREYVEKNLSLDRIVEIETGLYSKIINKHK